MGPPSHPLPGHSKRVLLPGKSRRVRGNDSGRPSLCRLYGCDREVFFDRRVNELREWCSDEHMRRAIINGVEKPCNDCQIWPRVNGSRLCSGNVCKYPGV